MEFGENPTRLIALSVAQEQALEWLFTGGSVTEAAQFAGVTRQTVSRWLRTDSDFRLVYETWTSEAAVIMRARMLAASEAAMDNVIHAVAVKRDLQTSKFLLKAVATRAKP